MRMGHGIPSLACALGACVGLYNINEGKVYWLSVPGLLQRGAGPQPAGYKWARVV